MAHLCRGRLGKCYARSFLTKNNWMKITGQWFAHVKRHFAGFHGFSRNTKLNNQSQSNLNRKLVCVKSTYKQWAHPVFLREEKTETVSLSSISWLEGPSSSKQIVQLWTRTRFSKSTLKRKQWHLKLRSVWVYFITVVSARQQLSLFELTKKGACCRRTEPFW